jgi:hypothetical protein
MAIPLERTDADLGCWKVPSELSSMDKLMYPQHNWLFNKADNAMPQANTLVYISGPISHDTPEGVQENLAVFTRAQRLLLSMGCDVYNPQHIQGPIDPLNKEAMWQYYMHFCIRALPECDAAFFLPDWQNSKGARWEHKIAELLGLKCFYAHVPDEMETRSPESTDETQRSAPPAALPDHE